MFSSFLKIPIGFPVGCTNKDNTTIDCGGILVNKITKDVQINTQQGSKKPDSIVYVENNIFKVKTFENGIGQSIILQHNDDGDVYIATIASPQVVSSMFVRTYYFDGVGLTSFVKFNEDVEPSGGVIQTWKIKWN